MNKHQIAAKKYLSQAFGLNQRIESKLGQIEELHDLATKATVTYSDMPKNPNKGHSRLEDAVIKIIELENEINKDMVELVELKKDIIRRIKAVESTELQTVLELSPAYRYPDQDPSQRLPRYLSFPKQTESRCRSYAHPC